MIEGQRQAGFTLIELLVVISIIGLLSSTILSSMNAARAKARDSTRKETARQLQKALELYYANNNAYPIQGGWTSSEPGDRVPYSANYIPGLVAGRYVAKLPRDPLGGNSSCGGGWKRAFLYASDGRGYKLLAHCSSESGYPHADVFIDPARRRATGERTHALLTDQTRAAGHGQYTLLIGYAFKHLILYAGQTFYN